MPEIHEMAGHQIRRLNQISTSVFAERMNQIGVTLTPVQFSALATIDRMPGVDQATLAGAIAYDRATIGGVIDRLETRGLLRREIAPHDRRARQLFMTDPGAQMLAHVTPVVREMQDTILTGLDAGERAEFLRLIKKATQAGNALSRAPLKTGGTG